MIENVLSVRFGWLVGQNKTFEDALGNFDGHFLFNFY